MNGSGSPIRTDTEQGLNLLPLPIGLYRRINLILTPVVHYDGIDDFTFKA